MSTASNRYTAILTSYNAENTIQRAIQGILEQEIPPEEIIIVDDCSTDKTVSNAKSLDVRSTRLRVFTNNENRGQSWGRNFAVMKCNSPYVIFFDDDDVSLPERSRIHVEHFCKTSSLSYTSSSKVYSNDYVIRNINSEISFSHIDFEDAFKLIFLGVPITRTAKTFVPSSTLAVSKSAFLELGGFDESLRRLEDMDFFLRAVKHQLKISWSASIGVARFHSNGSDKDSGQDSRFEQILIDRYGSEVVPEVSKHAQDLGVLRRIYFSRQYRKLFLSFVKNPRLIIIIVVKMRVVLRRILHERIIREQ